jgi:transposase-like protein
MRKNSKKEVASPEQSAVNAVLEEVLHDGARQMLQQAVELEVQEFIAGRKHLIDGNGRQLAVRNGYLPAREILTGLGPVLVRQPRVDDRKIRDFADEPVFSSKILPKYIRRIPSIDNLIPVLYLKGISTNDFPAALAAILGENAKGLSASTVVRLKEQWEHEYADWAKRDLSDKQYVYFWVDGIHFNIRLDGERSCILVIMGADEEGNKELVAVQDGIRESTLSWKEVLLDLKSRGLADAPKLAIGDGALGFWAALPEVFPETREQRCWVHKTANILDKVPKSVQPGMKRSIHEMYMAATKEDALEAYDQFIQLYDDKYPHAVECLVKDKEQLFTFYDFPAKHWIHIRTTNPIESTFATVRHRSRRTKGCGSRIATLTMTFKLVLEAQKTWKKIKGHKFIEHVLNNVPFINGIMQVAA